MSFAKILTFNCFSRETVVCLLYMHYCVFAFLCRTLVIDQGKILFRHKILSCELVIQCNRTHYVHNQFKRCVKPYSCLWEKRHRATERHLPYENGIAVHTVLLSGTAERVPHYKAPSRPVLDYSRPTCP